MGTVALCYDITKKLFHICQQSFEGSERNNIIQDIEVMFSERESLLREIIPPFSDEELVMGEQINEWNKFIEERLKILFSLVKADIQQTQKKKSNMVKYSHSYEDHHLDGIFYDKRN